jgi:hypothetical protein
MRTSLGYRVLATLMVLATAACALSPPVEVRNARQQMYQLCGERMSPAVCRSWAGGVASFVDLAERYPDDEYVQGQAVFALTRARALQQARLVANRCTSTGWWCSMLSAHVHAEAGELVEAEGVFARMLTQMPEAVRCAWTDLSWVLPEKVWASYSADDCAEEASRSETIWWLADPSHLLAGNEAKVMHYNRVALATLHDDQILSERGFVGDNEGHTLTHHRALLRRGMSDVDFERAWKLDARRSYSLLPSTDALLDPLATSRDSWNLVARSDDVRTEVGFGALFSIPSQVAFFERGDSVLATASIDLRDAQFSDGGPAWSAALILRTSADDDGFDVKTDSRQDQYVFQASLPRARYLVSLEARNGTGVGRTRFGHSLKHGIDEPVRLSDLLLYKARNRASADSLGGALPLMRGSHTWYTDETLGLYLEAYGTSEGTSYDVSVSLSSEEPGGILSRIGSFFGGAPDEPVEVTWQQQPDTDIAIVGLTVDLKNVEPGSYKIEVRVGDGGAIDVSSTSEIEVRSRQR